MDISKYQNIKIKGHNGRWSAIDEYSDGEADYILLESVSFGSRTANIICQITAAGELIMLGKTYELKLADALNELFGDTVKQGAHNYHQEVV